LASPQEKESCQNVFHSKDSIYTLATEIQGGYSMHALKITFRRAFVAAPFSILAVSLGMAQGTPAASRYTFTTFTVPGAVRLSVQSINSAGTVSGWFTDATGDSESFLRTADGTITTYVDPNNTSTPYNTAAYQINRSGIVAGGFLDTVRGAYSGFFYETSSGTFKTYNPKGTSITIRGVNDKGDFCGMAYTSLFIAWNSFTSFGGTINYFSVNGSTQSSCQYLNPGPLWESTLPPGSGTAGWAIRPARPVTSTTRARHRSRAVVPAAAWGPALTPSASTITESLSAIILTAPTTSMDSSWTPAAITTS
jgi:hypothetical protein